MEREELLEVLSLCKGSLSAQEFIPIQTHFCFTGNSVYAYNDVQCVEVEIETDLNCGLQGKMLYSVLSSYNQSEVDLTQDDGHVLIKAGKTKTKLPLLPSSDFVFEYPDDSQDTLKIKVDTTFLYGLKKCLISVGTDPRCPEEMGVTVSIDGADGYLYSTDNVTISRYKLPIKVLGGKFVNNISLPKEFCQTLLSLTEVLGDEEVILTVGDGSFAKADINESEAILFTRLIGNMDAIDFDGMINSHVTQEVMNGAVAITDDFVVSLERANLILASKEVIDGATEFKITPDCVSLHTESASGELDDSLDVSTGKTLSFSASPFFLSRACKNCETIVFADEAIVLTDKNYTHLVSHV